MRRKTSQDTGWPSPWGVAAASLVTGVSVLVGCGLLSRGSGPTNGAIDLVDEIGHAEVRQPTVEVHLGRPAAQRLMVQGWTLNSRKVPRGRARWTVGDRAELEFFVGRLADLEVTFRCAPVGGRNAVTRDLQLEINGEPWESVRLEPNLTVFRLDLPAELLRPGENRLQILHPAPQPTHMRLEKDVRVLWDFIRFENGDKPSQETVSTSDQEGGTLTIPMGMRVEYFLDLPAGSALTVGKLTGSSSPSGGHLRVTWEPDDGSAPQIIDDSFDWNKHPARLTSEPSSGRLSLHAVSSPASPVEPGSWIRLFAPRVLTGGPDPTVPRAAEVKPDRLTSDSGEKHNIIVYLVDTLRADRLGCYGYSRDTSPNIDKFANEAVLFERAQAQSPWTRASVASILTGLWPTVHGAEDDPHALSNKVVTLAELLRQAGYQTAAVVANGNTTEATGFAQGFETFLYLNGSSHHARSGAINASAFDWLQRRDTTAPFFLYLHTVDPHSPYEPPEPFRSGLAPEVSDIAVGGLESLKTLTSQSELPAAAVVQQVEWLYDAEIAANDATFGELLEELKRLGLFGNSLIVLLSDHGEEFFDHRSFEHGKTLYSEMLQTPLIVKLPNAAEGGYRVKDIVQHVDLVPTLLEVNGIPIPEGLQGRSFLPLLDLAAGDLWDDTAVAQMNLRGREGASLLSGHWKVIVRRSEGQSFFPELYDLSSDPGEQTNLAPTRPVLAKSLAVRLRKLEAEVALTRVAPDELTAEQSDQIEEGLRALGYIE